MTIEVSPVLFRKSSVNFSITTVWLNAGHIYTMSVKPDNPSRMSSYTAQTAIRNDCTDHVPRRVDDISLAVNHSKTQVFNTLTVPPRLLDKMALEGIAVREVV